MLGFSGWFAEMPGNARVVARVDFVASRFSTTLDMHEQPYPPNSVQPTSFENYFQY